GALRGVARDGAAEAGLDDAGPRLLRRARARAARLRGRAGEILARAGPAGNLSRRLAATGRGGADSLGGPLAHLPAGELRRRPAARDAARRGGLDAGPVRGWARRSR